MNLKTAADLPRYQDPGLHAQAAGVRSLLPTIEIQLVDRYSLADPRTACTKRDSSTGPKPQESTKFGVCPAELPVATKRAMEGHQAG